MPSRVDAVAVIGLGIMGSAIARNLLTRGTRVIGYDVASERIEAFAALGGEPVGSAMEAAIRAEIVLTSLPSAASLNATVSGILAAAPKELILVELSTLPLLDKERSRDRLAEFGIAMLDCPLSGTGAQAVTADLAVYASGQRAAYDRVAPIFSRFARVSHYLGEFGSGSKMKFVANLLVAIHNVATAEAMVLGKHAGLDPKLIVDVIRSGAGTSRVFELRAPMMASDSYEPASMKIDVWQKDMAIIAGFAASVGVTVPLFAASGPIYDAAVARGLGAQDTAAVSRVIESISVSPAKDS